MRWLLLFTFALTACRTVRPDDAPPRPRITEEAALKLLPEKTKDAPAWAAAVLGALDAHQLPADADTVCQVYAVIEQESGYEADPAVAGLSALVKEHLAEKAKKLGPVGKIALDDLMEQKAPGSKESFKKRLDKVRTEQDVDRLFRDIVAHYEDRFGAVFAVTDALGSLFGKRPEDFNPVTTAGSMQVSVRYAQKLAAEKKKEVSRVRDELYTRSGGVYYGAHRLLFHQAAYAQPLFRFADYNAGVYASRNAAFQEQVAKLTGIELATDGDLLAYDEAGEQKNIDTQTLLALLEFRAKFAPQLTPSRVRSDAEQEKSAAFESTETYRTVRRVYAQKFGVDPPYARVPDVALKSVKMSKARSTAWFAKNVDVRYQKCLDRAD